MIMDLNFDLATMAIRLWPFYLGIVILIGIGYLWEKKRRTAIKNDTAMDSYTNVLSRIFRFIFFEDIKPITMMKEKLDEDTQQPVKYPLPKQARFIYIIGIISSLVILLAYAAQAFDSIGYTFILPGLLLIIITTRARKVFVERNSMLIRMFQVADSEFKYKKGSAARPWSFIKIRKWEGDTVPGETIVSFPASWRSDDPRLRENFERHFKSTVTDENSWT